MAERRAVEEDHGDYQFVVEKDEQGAVRCFRIPRDRPTERKERLSSADLPSESLKDAFATFCGRSRAELRL